MRARLVRAVLHEPLAEARGQAAGQRDDALAVLRQQLHVDVRLAAVQPLEEAGRGELDEVAVAGVVLGQQREVVALDAARRRDVAVVDEVDLAARAIGLIPCFLHALYSSTAPFITPWSVRPSAGWPNAAARAARASILHAPSSSEYSEWTWRWAQDEGVTGAPW